MPADPTTKSQVQAYRFVLRRMESALVRKDPVMLHEPMRTQLRASAVGLILGVLGLAAFFVVGLFKPTSQIEVGDIVNIEGTPSVFLVVESSAGDEPRRLVPVLNLASARLLFAALSPGSQPPDTKIVEESALVELPRAPLTGLPDAPQALPHRERLIEGPWAVCDTATIRPDLADADTRAELTSTVALGTQPGRALGEREALLVTDEVSGARFLLWDGRRLPVDLSDSAVTLAYRLGDVTPRRISTSLLNAIPRGEALAAPRIPGARDPAPFPELPGVRVGDVVRVVLAGEPESFFLVLADGTQRVSPAVANLILFALGDDNELPTFPPESLAAVPQSRQPLNFAHFPDQLPTVLGVAEAPVACLVWLGHDQRPIVTVSPDGQLLAGRGVEVPGAPDDQVDRVLLATGRHGALVRGVVPGQPPDTGQIWLVTDQGLRYGIPSLDVAAVLGYRDYSPVPAPESILRLLQNGPVLDPRAASQRFDPELAQRTGR